MEEAWREEERPNTQRMKSSTDDDEDTAAALPNLDHLTIHDLRDIYEPSDDTFLLIDAIAVDIDEIRRLKPKIVIEIG